MLKYRWADGWLTLEQSHVRSSQPCYSYHPLHHDSSEILQFAAETCSLMSTTNCLISLSNGEMDGEKGDGEPGIMDLGMTESGITNQV